MSRYARIGGPFFYCSYCDDNSTALTCPKCGNRTSAAPAPAREASAEHLSPRQVSQPIRDESK
jgi:hypothetical protein